MTNGVTIGRLAALALAIAAEELGKGDLEEPTKDSYKSLKDKIAQWASGDVAALEGNPTSEARKAVVADVIERQSLDDQTSVRNLAAVLIKALENAHSDEAETDIGFYAKQLAVTNFYVGNKGTGTLPTQINRLNSSLLKVERAKRHFDELSSIITTFVKDAYAVSTEGDGSTKRIKAQLVALPNEVTLIVGDCIHNLRTSLDHMAVELSGNRDAHFPFGMNAETYKSSLVRNKIDRASPEIVTFFENLEPYPGGKDALLRDLHDLDIIDKHRLIVVLKSQFAMTNVNITNVKGRLKIDKLRVRGTIDIPADMTFQYDPQITIEIIFGPDQPFEDELVIPTLSTLVEKVKSTIEAFLTLINEGSSGTQGRSVPGNRVPN
jgi:hypothetical protein